MQGKVYLKKAQHTSKHDSGKIFNMRKLSKQTGVCDSVVLLLLSVPLPNI